jgi:hypothetical protein
MSICGRRGPAACGWSVSAPGEFGVASEVKIGQIRSGFPPCASGAVTGHIAKANCLQGTIGIYYGHPKSAEVIDVTVSASGRDIEERWGDQKLEFVLEFSSEAFGRMKMS